MKPAAKALATASPKKIIFVTRRIPESGLALLRKQRGFVVRVSRKDGVLTLRELKKNVRGAHAVLSLLNDHIDAAVMDAAGPQLKIIANFAVGFDNIDVGAARSRGITVTNTPGAPIADAVAEHAMALILALAKRLSEADRFTRAHHYHGWAPMLLLGADVTGKTLGIVGAGRIGASLARHAHDGFGMPVIYYDPHKNSELEKKFGARRVTFNTLLARADVVSLHVPLTPATRHLIDARALRRMKHTAFLINTARGPVVSEKDLERALYKKQIAGAALDVFECEPKIDCDLTDRYALNKLDNVILTPHTASATHTARSFMSTLAARNIIAVLRGRRALTPLV